MKKKYYIPLGIHEWESLMIDGENVKEPPTDTKAIGFVPVFESASAVVAEYPNFDVEELTPRVRP